MDEGDNFNSTARKRSSLQATDNSAGSDIDHTDSCELSIARGSKKQKRDTDLEGGDVEVHLPEGSVGHAATAANPKEQAGDRSSTRQRRRGTGGPWACRMCSFENPWLNAACEMCMSPRPNARTSDSDKEPVGHGARGRGSDVSSLSAACDALYHQTDLLSSSSLASDNLVEQQRKREAKLKRKLEATRRANLKALCHYAAMVSRGGVGSDGLPSIISDAQGSGASDDSVKTAQRGCGRPRGKASKENSQGTSATGRGHGGGASLHLNVTTLHSHGLPLKQQHHTAAEFETGTLIRYAFQDEDKAWVWYVGMVTGAWCRQPWYKVMFEDGEQLWVRLDPPSWGRMWKDIEVTSTSAAVETARFERNLEAASPVALEQLRIDLKDSGAKKVGRCEY